MTTTFTTVFLSSTARDLQPYRDAVAEAIVKMGGYHCVRMEDFGARNATPEEICQEEVSKADIFVGLIGHLYGSRPNGSELSFTQGEYEAAKAAEKPRLMFLATDAFLTPNSLREPDRAYRRQRRFREQVREERGVVSFDEPQKLATLVVAALQKLQEETRRGGRKTGRKKKTGGTDLSQTETLYLQYLAGRYQNLDFRGMGFSDRVPLRLQLLEMYVPLKARVQTPEGETWARHMRLAGRGVSGEEIEGMGERLSEQRPALDLLRQSSGLVLLGDPGSGKTTFLKFLTLQLAIGNGQVLELGELLPVPVPLSAYANALAKGDLSLGRFLSTYFEEREIPGLGALFEAKLAHGQLLLLFDGLDEVRELDRRNLVVHRVQDFYSRYRLAGNKFVLTSRVVGYREVRLAAEGLAEATLVDFDDQEIKAFVEKWTAAIEKAAVEDTRVAREEAGRERDELLAAVRANSSVRSLAANPLLLTILALMKRQGVALPDRRVELYQRYVETLLKHWNLARSLAGRGETLDLVETLRVLQPLALWMHETSPGVGLVKEGDLRRELEKILGERGENDPEKTAQRFLEDVREYTSLLLDRGGRQYGFIHLTFQEYLAAAALAQKGQQDVGPIVEVLAKHVGEAPWHEVSLLTLGYLGLVQQRDQAAGSVLEQLLARAPNPPGEAAVLAGRAVADMGTGVVPATCRTKVVDTLVATMRADTTVMAPVRAAAGAALADVGDTRPEVMTVDGMQFCWVPAGPFLMGSEEYEEERPQHECPLPYGYWMGRYPVTVAQFREFRDHPYGRANEPAMVVSWYDAVAFCEWLTEKWRKRLPVGWKVCLPSEAEWEKAARGGLEVPSKPFIAVSGESAGQIDLKDNGEPGRLYPWGEKADPNRANYSDTGIGDRSAVGCFPAGTSPYGCWEMSGNVWEWTRSLWGEERDPHYPYPYMADDGREDMQASSKVRRVLRGGSWIFGCGLLRCAARNWDLPDGRIDDLGFRVVSRPHSPLVSVPSDL